MPTNPILHYVILALLVIAGILLLFWAFKHILWVAVGIAIGALGQSQIAKLLPYWTALRSRL